MKIILISSIAFLLLLSIAGLYWLAIIVIIIAAICYWVFSLKLVKNYFLLNIGLKVLAIIFLAVLTRSLVLEIYIIPSESMENSLFIGDNIIVSKLNYGPKLPQSPYEISWFNLFFPRPEYNDDEYKWRYWRLKGFTTIKRQDIVVFKSVQGNQEFLIKRCLGLPGDILSINGSDVIIGDSVIKPAENVKILYSIWKKKTDGSGQLTDTMMSLTALGRQQLSRSIDFRSIEHAKSDQKVFPWNSAFNWTSTHFGPYKIPFKGMKIRMNVENFILYKSIIEVFEQGRVSFQNQQAYLDGQPIRTYTFKQNYYFMLGDNRAASQDSRYWGVLPESHIVGKAIAILYSSKPSFKWNRIMKIL